ncbi:TonB-dependent receptor [Sphingobium tyrosinilyticum]|uniref:TonB-dependent receptor n=2 Tax=Sphingobium tyrosinilyticum TaxID=2715436 RepID=A0ABV9EVF3_9SPHN
MRRSASLMLFLTMGASPAALMAQTDAPQEEGEEIIVTGQPQRGSVIGNIKPEQQLSAADVRALGVTSISEMISELSAQTNGTPVVLLNGKRISSFSEIQDIPSEAVARVDILPEQVALSYGYAPMQKVANIVLRQRFRAELADLRAGTTTDGGRENGSAEAGLLRIRGDNRFTLNLKYSNAAALLESERNIDRPMSGPAFIDLTHFRTLSPATESVSANATYARALGGVSMTVNGRVELSDNDTLQGLSAAALAAPLGDGPLYRDFLRENALDQQVRGTTGHVGLTFNGLLGKGWQWSFTGNGDVSDTRTRTERSASIDRASARSQAVTGDLLLSGPLFDLPAGTVTSSVRVGASANGFEGWSIRNGVERNNDYDRQIASGQVSLDMPITSKARGVLGGVGDIGITLNAAAQELSDFGTLSTLGYGMRWRPIPAVQLLVSANQDRAAPTGNQLTDPEVRTDNVPVFDYRTGETVFVTRVTGGNALLKESVRDQFRLSATVKPFDKPNLTLTATYLNSRTANPIAAFPEPTPAIEGAFPDRFLRDTDQRLTEIRASPVNYLRSQSEQLRWGFDLSFPLKSRIQKLVEAWRAAGAKPEDRPKELQDLRGLFGNRGGRRDGQGQSQTQGQGGQDGAPALSQDSGDRAHGEGGFGGPGGGGGRPGGGFGGPGGFGGGRGGGGGRLSFSLYHTWHFTESILIAPGVPELDLLNGDATGSSGGQPRHEVEARVGYSNNGLGARLSVDWESGTHVDGALGGTSRLNFGSLATANLRLFANLGQMPSLVKNHPFLRGARVSIGIDNIFNTRREVTDATGVTPLRYQQGYLDPLGRTISISFRKLFF